MENEKASGRHCKTCGKTVEGDREYCNTCIIKLAEENIPDADEKIHLISEPVQSRKKVVLQVCVLLVCIAAIAVQLPGMIDAFKEKQPIRQGTYQTSAKTDQCINNLWQISRLLQDGKKPGMDIVCPASGTPYLIFEKDGDIVAQCPNPDLHGFTEMRVSKDAPRPEVKQ